MEDDVLVDVFGSLSISAPEKGKGRHEDKENRAELANRSARALQQKAGLLAEKKEELARKKEELERRKQEQAVAKSSERQPSPNRARVHRAEKERSEERPTAAHGVKERKGEGVATPRRNSNTELSPRCVRGRPRPSVIVRKQRERELLDSLFGDDEGDSSPAEEEEVARPPRRTQVSASPARRATAATATSGTRKNELQIIGKSESEKRRDEAKRKADSAKRPNFRISMFVIREAEEEDKGSGWEGEDSGDDEYDLDDSFINDDVEECDDSDDDTDEDEDEQEIVECEDSDIEVVSEVCEIDANTKVKKKGKGTEKETIVIVLSSDDEDEESTQYYNDVVEVAQTKRKEIERMPHLKKAKEAEVLKTPTRPQAAPTTPRATHRATPRGARQPATGAAQPSTPAQRRERETKEEGIIGSDRRLDAIIERNVFTPREFKQRREALTRDLFREFNKRVFADQLPNDLPISWNSRLLTTAGLCKCVRKLGVRSASVELATKVCTNFQRLFETLIHELCHAGQWLVLEDSTMGHGATFRYWGKLATKAYPGLEVGTCHAYDTVTECRYRYQCTNPRCKTVVGRHSPSLDPSTYRCKSCGSSVEMLLAALARP